MSSLVMTKAAAGASKARSDFFETEVILIDARASRSREKKSISSCARVALGRPTVRMTSRVVKNLLTWNRIVQELLPE